jgi:hypothetical protein
MLDPWVIEEIKRREEERRRQPGQVDIHVPTPATPDSDSAKPPKEESGRGVVIIDLMMA